MLTWPKPIADWLWWVLILLLGPLLLVFAGGCKAQNVEVLDQYLTTLNKHGVTYSFHVTGPLDAGFEMYTGGRMTTGGWIDLKVQSPIINPLFEKSFELPPPQ